VIFTADFIERLREDPVVETIMICDLTIQKLSAEGNEGWSDKDFDILVEAYSLLVELMESGLLPIVVDIPNIEDGSPGQCPILYAFVSQVREECKAEAAKIRVTALRNRFRVSLASGFAYEFSQGDLDRVQDLVNQLRSLISATSNLGQEQQRRLL